MTQKSYAAGSAYPPLADGKLRIYSMRFCSFAESTHLVLAHLNVPHEVVNINMSSKPEWFLEKNPLGTLPVLEQGNKIICESKVCDEYLDDVYGKQALLSTDQQKRTSQKILMEKSSQVASGLHGLLKQTPEERQQAADALQKALDVFEEALAGKFFGGNGPNMVDFHMWPWFERFPALEKLAGVEILTKDRFPRLNSWVAHMLELPAVKAVLINTNLHVKFIEDSLKGNAPNYDLCLDLE